MHTSNKSGLSFSYGLMGGANFDFCYLNEGSSGPGKLRSKRAIDYWNKGNSLVAKGFKEKHIGNYKSPIGYASWKWVNAFLYQFITPDMQDSLAAFKTKQKSFTLNSIEETVLLSLTFAQSYLQPIYLTRAITEDLARTDFKGFDAAPNDIYPIYTFMLPKTSVTSAGMAQVLDDETITDDFYTIIVITHNHYRDVVRAIAKENKWPTLQALLDKEYYPPDDPRLNIFKPGFKMMALSNKAAWCIGDFIWEEGTKDWQILVDKKRLKMDQIEEEGTVRSEPLENEIGFPTNDPDSSRYLKIKNAPNEEIAKNLLNIAANSILLMDHQPEYLTEQSPLLGGRGFKEETPPKPSTWLGENYEGQKIRYEYPPDYVPTEGKSPRSHWRRGHMRHVCQGKGRKQRVLTWIKPVFVVGRGVE